MPIIFVPIEVSEEEVARLSLASQGMAGSYSPVTSSQNPAQSAAGPASQQGGDPWENAVPAQQYHQQQQGYASGGQQYAQQNQYQAQQGAQQYQQAPQGQGDAPTCVHGPRVLQPAGTNRNTGESYSAYWKCPLDRNVPGRCKNYYPGR